MNANRIDGVFVVGVTGGICSGKSKLCSIMAEKGIGIVDSDSIGHEVMNEEHMNDLIINEFGDRVKGEDGKYDRKKLAAMVFNDKTKLQRLNELTWSIIEQRVRERVIQLRDEGKTIVAVEAAMLINTTWMNWMDYIWVLTISPNIAIARMMANRGLTKPECIKRIKSQPKSNVYARYADILIDTRHNKKTQEHIFKNEIDEFIQYVNKRKEN